MRSFAYYATLAALTLGVGCGSPEPAPSAARGVAGAAGAALGMCEQYRNTIPLAYERCLISAARGLPTVEMMTEVCNKTGSLQSDCHSEWVDGRMRVGDLPAATLLAACAPSPDCALTVLDSHPNADVLVQMKLCEAAGRFRGFCIGHAARRWAATEPDAVEIARVMAGANHDADVVGPTVGIMVACRGVGSCPGDGSPVDVACQREADAVRAGRTQCLDPKVSSGEIDRRSTR
ncbi:hypothetical protein LBMAG42_43880 [Deltaproteobacteria bacterium]|nr:hypothetical protein LBMAG42_43880 [Deltaproteobacteria bacterium]